MKGILALPLFLLALSSTPTFAFDNIEMPSAEGCSDIHMEILGVCVWKPYVSTRNIRDLQKEIKQFKATNAPISTNTEAAPVDGVNCELAVKNGKLWLKRLQEAGQQHAGTTKLSKAEYEEGSKELLRIEQQISVSECQSATGNVKAFYACMTDSSTHIGICGRRHQYN